jgi:hypothetical protein
LPRYRQPVEQFVGRRIAEFRLVLEGVEPARRHIATHHGAVVRNHLFESLEQESGVSNP